MKYRIKFTAVQTAVKWVTATPKEQFTPYLEVPESLEECLQKAYNSGTCNNLSQGDKNVVENQLQNWYSGTHKPGWIGEIVLSIKGVYVIKDTKMQYREVPYPPTDKVELKEHIKILYQLWEYAQFATWAYVEDTAKIRSNHLYGIVVQNVGPPNIAQINGKNLHEQIKILPSSQRDKYKNKVAKFVGKGIIIDWNDLICDYYKGLWTNKKHTDSFITYVTALRNICAHTTNSTTQANAVQKHMTPKMCNLIQKGKVIWRSRKITFEQPSGALSNDFSFIGDMELLCKDLLNWIDRN